MRDFRQLGVWQKAHELALLIYTQTAQFPQQERVGLGATMRRAAIAIPMNIAEGCGQSDRIEFGKCTRNAIGLTSELEYLVLLARDLNLIESTLHERAYDSIAEVRKMLTGLSKSVSQQVLRAEG
ncbi:MAG TPA: four helix bundle protein [Terriglobales bacterium]|nr:four helix bundle protein [Terriglobales bacterium]